MPTYTYPNKSTVEHEILLEDSFELLTEDGFNLLQENNSPDWSTGTRATTTWSSGNRGTTSWTSPNKS